MAMTDRFDLPVTSASAAAIGDYVAAVDLLLSANTGAAELLERALAADPDFVLAHVARARLLQLQARMPEARAAAARAKELRGGVSAREQQHIDTISRAVEGSATEALALVYTHVSEYPRDALPLSLALGVFGLLGFSGRLDHHEAQLALLEELAPHWGDDWWFLGDLGWAYIETGEVAAGTRLVERSLAGNPRNAHAAHQRVHGFFEAGDPSGGADFIRAWLADYDRAGHLHCHLSWHLALFELARGDAECARAVTSTASGHRSRNRRRCSPSPTRRRSYGAGGSMAQPHLSISNGGGRRTRAPAFSPGQSRLRRSACGLCRNSDRR